MRVHVVDPSAYTPPYDHALCRALGAEGAEVELFTSRFAYGPVAVPEGYRRRELFYRAARFAPDRSKIGQRAQRIAKLAEHVPDMLRYRRAARAADIVHFQWLAVQHLDGFLLPRGRRASRTGHPAAPRRSRPALVLTAHDVMPREPRPGQLSAQRRLYDRFDAIVVHSEHGRERLTRELGVDPDRVHVIPHGVFTHLAEAPPQPSPFQTDKPVVLCFGLMRPYKGIDVLLQAWRMLGTPPADPLADPHTTPTTRPADPPALDAELWIVGMPRMDISHLRAIAPPSVRFVPRFIADSELPAYFQRADLVVLPYREIDQSGVLFTALAFGKPLLLSDVGGFGEIAATGAARTVSAGDPVALHGVLAELLGDPAALAAMAARARDAIAGEYAWEMIARRTLTLYESLLREKAGGDHFK
jgi:glycosyltransferase involved in cell wall biosynthesis